ncbi:ABC transporter permease [Nakamurella leprariae]|uniref:ABC transporter permease n=1 Tax=Nakamurella leprariae TaxID=2803911 RepID=A0A938YAU6_9ACTN|nr:ABC transporter permease [Nakamurella leprariae]MBM9466206.1 ABC transporter permease [Nakamurella leprariae]
MSRTDAVPSGASARPVPGTTAGSGPFLPGTFRPAPRPAAAWRRALALAGLELRITLRNGEQLLLALVIPVAGLIGMTVSSIVDLPEPRVDAVVPGILSLAVLSTAFTSQAIVTGFDRRYGVLRRLAAAGVGRGQLVAGKVLAVLAVLAGQIVVLGVIAAFLGWDPHGNPLWAVLLVLLGAAALVGLALLVGGLLRAEAVLAVANVVWLVLVGVGGVIVPLDRGPEWFQTVGSLTPVGALSDGLREVLQHGHAPSWTHLAVLAGWIVIGWAGTVRWFRWL